MTDGAEVYQELRKKVKGERRKFEELNKTKDKSKKIKVEEKKNDLCERLFEFAVRVIK